MVDSASAIEFVKSQGNVFEKARLKLLLENQPPADNIIVTFESKQRNDGGWAQLWAPEYSSLDATCFHLAQAEQLGLNGDVPFVARALEFMVQRQRDDGSFEEESSVEASAPSWIKPGDKAATLYLTANCGFWLAVLGGRPKSAAQAASYLAAHEIDGRLPTFPHAHWLSGALWYSLNQRDQAERVFRHLEGLLAELSASNLAWLMTALCAVHLPAHHPLLAGAASQLEQDQQDDGRWCSEDGPVRDAHTTLEALRVLRLCGRI
jgi:hypothetical protein